MNENLAWRQLGPGVHKILAGWYRVELEAFGLGTADNGAPHKDSKPEV